MNAIDDPDAPRFVRRDAPDRSVVFGRSSRVTVSRHHSSLIIHHSFIIHSFITHSSCNVMSSHDPLVASHRIARASRSCTTDRHIEPRRRRGRCRSRRRWTSSSSAPASRDYTRRGARRWRRRNHRWDEAAATMDDDVDIGRGRRARGERETTRTRRRFRGVRFDGCARWCSKRETRWADACARRETRRRGT
jgi:hypothetical protein